MKLQNELNKIVEAYSTNKLAIETYARKLKESKDYNNFETRLAHDIIKGIMGTTYICDLYDKYGCNDSHVKTLSIQALKKANIEF